MANHSIESIASIISELSAEQLKHALESVKGTDYVDKAIREVLRVAIEQKLLQDVRVH
jgi:hypothetical protein